MKNASFLAWFAAGHLAIDWPIAALWLIVPSAGLAMKLSPAEVGLLFTIFNVGGALAFLPFGVLADHVANRGRLLAATFWWVAIGYGIAALAPGFLSLALLLAVAGMGNAAWHPIATGVLAREAKDSRAQALGIHALGGSAAEILAPLSVGLLLSQFEWRDALIISILPTLVLGVCFFWVARAIPRVDAKPFVRRDMIEPFHSWRRGSGLRLVAMICFYNMALMALLSMIPLYLVDARNMSAAAVGLTFAALLVAGAIAQPWVGALSGRIGRRLVLVVGNLAAGLASAALMLEPTLVVMVGIMAISVAAMDAIRSAMLAAAVDRAGQREGTTLGLAFLLMDGVGAFGAVFAGIAASYSWSHMFGAAAAFSITAAALALTTAFGQSPGAE